jgi:hypothetical protein
MLVLIIKQVQMGVLSVGNSTALNPLTVNLRRAHTRLRLEIPVPLLESSSAALPLDSSPKTDPKQQERGCTHSLIETSVSPVPSELYRQPSPGV